MGCGSMPASCWWEQNEMLLSPPLVCFVFVGQRKGQLKEAGAEKTTQPVALKSHWRITFLAGCWLTAVSALLTVSHPRLQPGTHTLHRKNKRGDGEYQLGDGVWQQGEICTQAPLWWCQSGVWCAWKRNMRYLKGHQRKLNPESFHAFAPDITHNPLRLHSFPPHLASQTLTFDSK